MKQKPKTTRKILAADLFCGAGGSSTALLSAYWQNASE